MLNFRFILPLTRRNDD